MFSQLLFGLILGTRNGQLMVDLATWGEGKIRGRNQIKGSKMATKRRAKLKEKRFVVLFESSSQNIA